MDTVTLIERTLAAKQEPLPSEAVDYLRRHPRTAARLWHSVEHLERGQYIEYHFRLTADAWAANPVLAQETIRDELFFSVGSFEIKWTGRWRVASIPEEHLAFVQG